MFLRHITVEECDKIMKSKNNPKIRSHRYVSDFFDDADIVNSSSANDCTGLIPTSPQSDEELDSYEDVYDFRPPFGKN